MDISAAELEIQTGDAFRIETNHRYLTYQENGDALLQAKIEGGAGSVTIRSGYLHNADMDMGVGAFHFTGELDGNSCMDYGIGGRSSFDTHEVSGGDPLEIFTDRDGEVIFKKYSPIGELLNFATQYADTLYKTCTNPIIICDRDSVVAFAGVSKKECAEKKVSSDIEAIMENRQLYCYAPGEKEQYMIDGNEKIALSCAMPIIAAGDVIGAVATILKENERMAPSDVEIKLIQTAAVFLGKQLEE